MVQWSAVLWGIVTAFALGLLGGLGLPFTDFSFPIIGAGVTGLVAGGVSGYLAHEGLWSGAIHGFLATSIGGLLVGMVLLFTGTLVAGIFGFSAAVIYLVFVVAQSLPGVIGGAIGGVLSPEETTTGQPTT
jgi:hypothetical protein